MKRVGNLSRVMYGVVLLVLPGCFITHSAVLSTGDGLRIELDNTTGAVRSLVVGNEDIPLVQNVEGGFFILPVRTLSRGSE
ncbi:MAG: hypothetical protein NC832_01160, partial [Candidatus Omnitrophica bacterium]|nr:hypothetical protein [Candidatus Omnitrophota bacterium]